MVEKLATGPHETVARETPPVTVLGVHKTFVLPHQRRTTMKEHLLHPFASRSFERLEALHDVSLEVERGEFFAVVGRNGSGKSTLLRCLAGIYPVDAGAIVLEGRLAPFIELGVGFNVELPARDNVISNAVILGLSRKQAAERADEILAFAELERFADQKLKNFSTGMGVRLAFAVAVHVDADVFLFDEVLAVGDAAFSQKCFAHFDRLRAERKTVILVTHDMGLVQSSCDRALLLDRGRVVDLGAPESVAKEYADLNAGRATLARVRPQPVPRELPPPGRQPFLGARPRRFASLVRLLALTDFKLKYMDATLSYAWAVARPLAIFGVMLLVFTRVGRFDVGVRFYPVYLLMAVVLWTFYSQATESSVRCLLRRASFLRKLPFPHLAVPLAQVVTSLIDLAANLLVVGIFMLAYGVTPRAGWLELIPLVLLLAIFATGLALLLSALFVRYRDVDQLWMLVLQVTFFCTPIFYAAGSIPAPFDRILVLVNPVATILTEARHAVIDPEAPSAASIAGGYPWLLVPLGIVAASVVLGFWVFRRESPSAAENV